MPPHIISAACLGIFFGVLLEWFGDVHERTGLLRRNFIVAAVAAALVSGSAAISIKSGSNRTGSSEHKVGNPSIIQLNGSEKKIAEPTRQEIEFFENMNQCAGTMQHYRLPPTGYDPQTESAESQAGRQLYNKLDCASCHKIKGSGGTLGPPLDGIGGARGAQFITAHLLDPEKQMQEFPDLFGGRPNIMPHPGVSLNDAKALASYLLTLPEPKNGFLILSHAKLHSPKHKKPEALTHSKTSGPTPTGTGRDLFLSHGCAACHTLNNSAPRFGPRLDGIAKRRTRLQLEEAMHGGTDEPEMNFKVYHLTNQEAGQIVDFLIKLPAAK
ncbi:hypothetical protein BH10CYA1_BH10CYA1_46330 [soil metagenome]